VLKRSQFRRHVRPTKPPLVRLTLRVSVVCYEKAESPKVGSLDDDDDQKVALRSSRTMAFVVLPTTCSLLRTPTLNERLVCILKFASCTSPNRSVKSINTIYKKERTRICTMKNHGMHITINNRSAAQPSFPPSFPVSYMMLFSVLSYVLFVISVCAGTYVCVCACALLCCTVPFPRTTVFW